MNQEIEKESDTGIRLNTDAMQEVLEQWFMDEIGLNMDTRDFKKLCDDMIAAGLAS